MTLSPNKKRFPLSFYIPLANFVNLTTQPSSPRNHLTSGHINAAQEEEEASLVAFERSGESPEQLARIDLHPVSHRTGLSEAISPAPNADKCIPLDRLSERTTITTPGYLVANRAPHDYRFADSLQPFLNRMLVLSILAKWVLWTNSGGGLDRENAVQMWRMDCGGWHTPEFAGTAYRRRETCSAL
ncbi:hypothetical protein K440DRAFT_643540 [Wilcoxina mikolae CBS 423.85]|nr:hypothetical protein K440DRAFT_643540 [Wilcoxina mikolae CBS 423.85]